MINQLEEAGQQPMPPKYQQENSGNLTTTTDSLLRDMHTKVSELHVTFFGVNGQGGHLQDYEKTKEKVDNHDKKLYMALGAFAVISFLLKLIHF